MSDEDNLTGSGEEALSRLAGGSVLDVATGSGCFINLMVENLRSYEEISGIDSSLKAIEAAKKGHPLENIHFSHMDATRMGFCNQSFDTVCMANSMHHMSDLAGVLAEMKRVCKSGGNIILSEMFCDGQSETQLTHVYLHHWWAAVDRAEGITHYETFPRQQLAEIAGKMGMERIRLYELKDLEGDPLEADLLRELDGIIDRYIQRAQGLAKGTQLMQRGEELRQRAHRVGFHAATSVLIIGKN
jgi:ubiquinone/menaquinone biosynthesis C-methylase UbiE